MNKAITKSKNYKIIKAKYNSKKEWKLDPKGFFTIKEFPKENLIKVRYYKIKNGKYELQCLFEGENAEELYNTICKKNLISFLEHAAYLGAELQKAELALKFKLKYDQDSQLSIKR